VRFYETLSNSVEMDGVGRIDRDHDIVRRRQRRRRRDNTTAATTTASAVRDHF
jgi:hypothetical protein